MTELEKQIYSRYGAPPKTQKKEETISYIIQIICKYVQRKADGLLCMKGENFGARCCTENCPIVKKIADIHL